MDKLLKFEKAILEFLENYSKGYNNSVDGLDTQLIVDPRGHHYQLLRVGWHDKKFVHFCVFHFDIKDNKIWVQVNETEEQIVDELVRRGISVVDIVLGFQPEYQRNASEARLVA
jgi:XisI protein